MNQELIDAEIGKTLNNILGNLNDRSGVNLDFDDDIQKEMEEDLKSYINDLIHWYNKLLYSEINDELEVEKACYSPSEGEYRIIEELQAKFAKDLSTH